MNDIRLLADIIARLKKLIGTSRYCSLGCLEDRSAGFACRCRHTFKTTARQV